MSPMRKITQRLKDWRHERQIMDTAAACKAAIAAGRGEQAMQLHRELAVLVAARSPEQIARMERDMGLAR